MQKMNRKAASVLLLLLIIAANICRNFLWLIPASLMAPIMEDLSLTYAQAGQLSLIVTMVMGVFLIVGSYVLGRIGTVHALIIGLCCTAVDGLFSYFGTSFLWIMTGKVFCGIGYGLTTCSITALIASLFPREKLGLLNGLNVCITSLTISLAYRYIVPLASSVGSWQRESLLWGVCSAAAAVLFVLWYQFCCPPLKLGKRTNHLREALRYGAVCRIVLIVSCIMLIYVSMNSYYPNYLHQYKQFSLETASRMVSYLSVSGVIGSLITGAVTQRIRSHKRFMMALIVGTLFGFLGMVFLQQYGWLLCSICCFGFCYCALSTFCTTTIMRIPGISPLTASAGVSLMNALGSLVSILVPTVQQLLTNQVGMQGAMLAFSVLFVPSAVCLLSMSDMGKCITLKEERL